MHSCVIVHLHGLFAVLGSTNESTQPYVPRAAKRRNEHGNLNSFLFFSSKKAF